MARNWQFIMLHHSATAPDLTVENLRQMHLQRGFADIGYHYVLVRVGDGLALKRGRPDTQSGAHAGAGNWNSKALGVCTVGYFHHGNSLSESFTGSMYDDLVGAVAHLCKKYGIPPTNIRYHRDVKATACPGDQFPDKAQLIADVTEAMQ